MCITQARDQGASTSMEHTHGRIALEIVFVVDDSNLGKSLAWGLIYYKPLWIIWG